MRIFTRSEEGVRLWQQWYCWMPIGAFVVIDECQDIFTDHVGFKMQKSQYQPLETYLPDLPDGFAELFHSRWHPVDPDTFDAGDTDDTGRTQLDENNRLLYPFNFYGAFMRHRKYQWDIVMLTPDWTSIPTSLRGCAQEAFSHRSTDTFFRKRKPRIFNHSPKATSTEPPKGDKSNVYSRKIPVDVFALYQSTGTGGFNESKASASFLYQPKLWLAFIVFFAALGYVFYAFSKMGDSAETEITTLPAPAGMPGVAVPAGGVAPASAPGAVETVPGSGGVAVGRPAVEAGRARGLVGAHLGEISAIPLFHGAKSVYVTAVQDVYESIMPGMRSKARTDILLQVVTETGDLWLHSDVLDKHGFTFKVFDVCAVQVSYEDHSLMLGCPPRDTYAPESDSLPSSPKPAEISLFG